MLLVRMHRYMYASRLYLSYVQFYEYLGVSAVFRVVKCSSSFTYEAIHQTHVNAYAGVINIKFLNLDINGSVLPLLKYTMVHYSA